MKIDARAVKFLAEKVMGWEADPPDSLGLGTSDMIRFLRPGKSSIFWWPDCPAHGNWNPLTWHDCMELQAKLSSDIRQLYCHSLLELQKIGDLGYVPHEPGYVWIQFASPAQRVEAMLRALGYQEEENAKK